MPNGRKPLGRSGRGDVPRKPGRTGYPTRYTDTGFGSRDAPAASYAPGGGGGGEIEMTTVYERFYDMTPEGQARAELDVANEAGNRLMDAYNALRAELATTRAELDAAQCRADAANRFASAAADRVLAEMERAADAWRRVAELEAELDALKAVPIEYCLTTGTHDPTHSARYYCSLQLRDYALKVLALLHGVDAERPTNAQLNRVPRTVGKNAGWLEHPGKTADDETQPADLRDLARWLTTTLADVAALEVATANATTQEAS